MSDLDADTKHLEAAIRANKRMLMLLDKQLKEAGELTPELLLATEDVDQCFPYFYVTEDGNDHNPGILFAAAQTGKFNVTSPYTGFVHVESDSAFVLERIFCAVKLPTHNHGNNIGYVDAATACALTGGYGVRLYDESNARWLSIGNDTNQTSQDAVVPITMFGPSFFANPGGGLEIPAQCVFPRNASIRVDAFATTNSTPTTARLSVIFQGYKVFGG